MLSRLAERANVAQFVSFVPARRCRSVAPACGHGPDHRFSPAPPRRSGPCWPWPPAARSTSAASGPGRPGRAVQLRPDPPRRRPGGAARPGRRGPAHHRQRDHRRRRRRRVRGRPRRPGRVRPGATPRSVEQPGTVALGHAAALRLLSTVYGFTPSSTATPASGTSSASIPWSPGSARPTRSSGSEPVEPLALTRRLAWPNAFSRFLGDKAFGLLVADLLELPVPATTVVGRRSPPSASAGPPAAGSAGSAPARPSRPRPFHPAGLAGPVRSAGQRGPVGTAVVSRWPREGARPLVGRGRPAATAACWSRGWPASATTSCWPGRRRWRCRRRG